MLVVANFSQDCELLKFSELFAVPLEMCGELRIANFFFLKFAI